MRFLILVVAMVGLAAPAGGTHTLDDLITFDEPEGTYSNFPFIIQPDVRRLDGITWPGPIGGATDLILDFSVAGLTRATWGIDNLLVRVIPEPSTGVLVAIAIGSIAIARRAQRRG